MTINLLKQPNKAYDYWNYCAYSLYKPLLSSQLFKDSMYAWLAYVLMNTFVLSKVSKCLAFLPVKYRFCSY